METQPESGMDKNTNLEDAAAAAQANLLPIAVAEASERAADDL